MTYTVWYRNPGALLRRKVKRVKVDGVEPGLFRWLVLEDDTFIYLSLHAEIEFSPQRFYAQKQQLQQESGGQIKL